MQARWIVFCAPVTRSLHDSQMVDEARRATMGCPCRIVLAFILFAMVSGSRADLSLDPLQEAAEKGNAESQYQMGMLFEFGVNRPKDSVTALAWYMWAGAQGHVLAAKRSALLESRLTSAEAESARKIAERLAAPKKPVPETVTPAETSPTTPDR